MPKTKPATKATEDSANQVTVKWPWHDELHAWMGTSSERRQQMLDAFRLHYVHSDGIIMSQSEWLSSLRPNAEPYKITRNETMVQLLVFVLARRATRKVGGDDARQFAAALRSRHNEKHYEQMASEFEKQIKFIAGTRKGASILADFERIFAESTVAMGDLVATVAKYRVVFTGTTPNDSLASATYRGAGQRLSSLFDVNAQKFESIQAYLTENRLRLVDLFRRFDKDGSGSLSRDEFATGLKTVGIRMQKTEFDDLIKQLDENGDGMLDYKEMLSGKTAFTAFTREATRASMSGGGPPPSEDAFARGSTTILPSTVEDQSETKASASPATAETLTRESLVENPGIEFTSYDLIDLALHCHYITRP